MIAFLSMAWTTNSMAAIYSYSRQREEGRCRFDIASPVPGGERSASAAWAPERPIGLTRALINISVQGSSLDASSQKRSLRLRPL